MTGDRPAGQRGEASTALGSPPGAATATLRVGTLDSDREFHAVFDERVFQAGWERVVLPLSVVPASIPPLRLHAIVVDLAVFGSSCWDWLDRLCRALPNLPVVVCTSASTVAQRVQGLRLGADDWISKPCDLDELVARVAALVNRRGTLPRPKARATRIGEIEIDAEGRKALGSGRAIELTGREFELIELLASSEGRVLERDFIYQRLWGYTMVRGDRSVDVFVRKLRRKLETVSPAWRYIHTHFGVGYSFGAQPSDQLEGRRDRAATAGLTTGARASGGSIRSGAGELLDYAAVRGASDTSA